jgi:ABC-type transport system involved in multi-copper enzyme maturation permease subunit
MPKATNPLLRRGFVANLRLSLRLHSIDKLNIPASVSNLLGGADYGTITGWFRSEIAVIYGPLVIGALAITGAAATTAGEEEDRILALVLAYPIRRSRLIAAKAAAIAVVVVIVAFGSAISWLKYLSPFYYYAGHDPLTHGVYILGLIVLGVLTLLLTGLALVTIERRDIRG